MPFNFGRKPVPAPLPVPPPVAPPPAVAFDPSNGNPVVADALARYGAGDWRSIEAAHGESRDWATRSAVAQSLLGMPPAVEWQNSCPRSSLGWSVRGAQFIRMAWDIRGNGKATTVADSSWGDFFATLSEADRSLRIAAELDPEDPYPWSQLLWTGNGLQVSKDDILQRFAELQRRDAGHYHGWLAVIPAVSKKWGGSHELMFDVARDGDRKLPSGSVGRVGVARAHEERRLYMSAFDDDREGAKNYFKSPDVAAELSAAASNSVFSDYLRPDASTRQAQSWFSYSLALVGDVLPAERLRAAALFRQIGDSGIPMQPWQIRYGAHGGEQYARIRAICYRAAGS
jgi:hypothetical protein